MIVTNLTAWAVLPFLMLGLIARVKSLWAGRRGPPLLQPAHDVLRLLRKQRVLSFTSTPVFRIAPYVSLVTSAAGAALVPILAGSPLLASAYDFVWLAYVWGLGRVASMLAALDTGSAFEGMGAAREATLSSLTEPVLFLVSGTLCLASHTTSLHAALAWQAQHGSAPVTALCSAALLIALQVETSRMPVDDPTTHLELTMVHEVMVLDHSGPDLAAIQWSVALKLTTLSSLLAMLLNPCLGASADLAAGANLLLHAGIAACVGTIEALSARLRLRVLPRYILVAVACAGVALISTTWRAGGLP